MRKTAREASRVGRATGALLLAGTMSLASGSQERNGQVMPTLGKAPYSESLRSNQLVLPKDKPDSLRIMISGQALASADGVISDSGVGDYCNVLFVRVPTQGGGDSASTRGNTQSTYHMTSTHFSPWLDTLALRAFVWVSRRSEPCLT